MRGRCWCASVGAAVLLALLGCGPGSGGGQNGAATPGGGAATGDGGTSVADAGVPGGSVTGSTTPTDGGSPDPSGGGTPVANADVPGASVPGSSSPTCDAGQDLCGTTCVDVHATDSSNCGACGRACPAGSRCNFGVCFFTTCAGTQTFCPTDNALRPESCTDLQSDPRNCGACGQACSTNHCSNGVCSDPTSTICASGDLLCGSVCVLPSSDLKNCGACGNACAANEICTNGQCTASCPQTGDVICPATTGVPQYCADLATSFGNCGACRNTCTGPNDICQDGQCVAGGQQLCATGQTWCAAGQTPAGCYDLQTDGQHCGACDASPCHSLSLGPGVCVSGVCVFKP